MNSKVEKAIKSTYSQFYVALLRLPSYMRETMSIVTGTSCMQISTFLLNDIILNSDKYKVKTIQKTLDQILTLILELNKIYNIDATDNYNILAIRGFISYNTIIYNSLNLIEIGVAYSRINIKELSKNNEDYFNNLKGYQYLTKMFKVFGDFNQQKSLSFQTFFTDFYPIISLD